jgi:hypothetical protein
VTWLKRLAAIIFWFALVHSAHAQSVQQSGNVTPTHLACWTTNGVVQDCGSAFNPYASGIGAIGPVCSLSAGITGPYQQFCLQAGSSGGVLSIQNFGGATAGGISFNVNGVPANFATVPATTTNGDFACFINSTGTLGDCGSSPGTFFTVASGTTTYWVNGNSISTAICGPTGGSTCSAGSDSNNCLSAGASCLTLQHAINLALNSTWQGGNGININLAHNTGTTNYTGQCYQAIPGWTVLTISGDSSSPAAVVMQANNAGVILAVKDACILSISNVKLIDSASNNATNFLSVGVGGPGHVDMSNITFGGMTIGTFIGISYSGATVTINGTNSILGGANAAFSLSNGATLEIDGTFTGANALAWTTGFMVIQNGGSVAAVTTSTFPSASFTANTGPRCLIDGPVAIGVLLDPNTLFPGNSNCSYVGQKVSNVLASSVSLSNTSNYFTGPTVAANDNRGTWLVTGSALVNSTNSANDIFRCKLWDGITIISSTQVFNLNGTAGFDSALSGTITSPAGNLRIDCRDISSTLGSIEANDSGNTHDSVITAVRIY